MDSSSKKVLLEVLTSLKDIWDWAPILEKNLRGGYFNDALIEQIDTFLREKARNYRQGKETEKIEELKEKMSKYKEIESQGKNKDTDEAAIVLGFIA